MTEPHQHFVLTRFNVDIGPHRRSWDDAWLTARFELFRSFCLPSVRDQTDQDFTWLVFFSASSRATVEPFLAALPAMPNLHPVWTSGRFDGATASHAVAGHHDGSSTRLMTTRLDCDDALRADVVARLRAADEGRPVEALNFPLGYQLADGRFFLAYDPANAFCTLVEDATPEAPARTVYCVEHQTIASVAPLRQLDWSPSWLQVVHDLNLANDTNGVRVGRRRAARRFANVPAVAALPPGEDWRDVLSGFVRSVVALGRKVVTRPSARSRLASLLPRRRPGAGSE